jgi:raffinose/stachyose/melibiose transport system substrate-binding protein
VEDIHKNAATLGFDAFAATDLDDSSSWRVTGHLANLEYYYEEKDDGGWTRPLPPSRAPTSPTTRRSSTSLSTTPPRSPRPSRTGGHDPSTEFTSGKAAFFFTGSWDYATISKGPEEHHDDSVLLRRVRRGEGRSQQRYRELPRPSTTTPPTRTRRPRWTSWLWLVSDPDASKTMVENLGILPYKNAPEGDNPYLNNAEEYSKGCYTMDWATNFQPNVDPTVPLSSLL